MPTSEIDDIFSAKGKAKAVESLLPLPPDVKTEKKKKKKKKDKHHAGEKTSEIEPSSRPKKRPLPETVVDPSSKSSSSSSSSKRPKLDTSASSRLIKHKHKEDEDRFKNSRGTGSRRKTDDGYNIYKEDELQISNAGGDTPLCPFDCNCCF